ncbi:DUF2304 domain-containing protein [Curtanaerobium respiraculi]|uniref:DUF2304 domain-containing protein n=1 Tax=Curtanaerobium respiraculi TaxID=2949669 RepID=UPI0024B342CA|nr:DUF2304 domain-containing protein [Curtanaerobium respiraculi]
MTIALRITLLVLCVALLLAVFRLIGRGRLQIRYALLWMVLVVLMVVCALFPSLVSAMTGFFGFEYSSNFIFSVGIVSVLVIALSLSMVVSWQARYIRSLVQTSALLEHRVRDLEQQAESREASLRE